MERSTPGKRQRPTISRPLVFGLLRLTSFALGCPPEDPLGDPPKVRLAKRKKKKKPPEPPPQEVVMAEPIGIPGEDCPVPPRWLRMRACQWEGWAYAHGEAPLGLNPSHGRSRASLQARWSLAKSLGKVAKRRRIKLEGYEVPEVFSCEGTAHALARIKTSSDLPRCRAAVEGQTVPPEDCPDWARGESWSTEDEVLGVSVVTNIKNKGLARSAAIRRARRAAALVRQVTLVKNDESLQALTETTLLPTVRTEIAHCANATWGLMVVEKRGLR